MSELQLFNFQGNQVRTVMFDNELFFVGKDVAIALGYTNPTAEIAKHVDNDDKKVLSYKAFNESLKALWGGKDFSSKTIINESGVYALVFGSKLKQAKIFKHWVTSEVLPSIRKNGSYSTEQHITSDEIAMRNKELAFKERWLKAMEVQNANKRAELLLKIAGHTHGNLYQQLMDEATNQLTFPIYQDKALTAGDIAEQLGVSPYTIGIWGQRLGLKAPKGMSNRYGFWKNNRYYYNQSAVDSLFEHQNEILGDEK